MAIRPTLNADGTLLLLPTGERIPWDAANSRAVDGGRATRLWEAAKVEYGITEPDPYVAPPISSDAVNAERDRRAFSGFSFGGKRFQSRIEDQKRINGAGTLAVMAIVSGAQVGNLRWHGGESDFVWISEDNSLVPMDAHTVLAFGQAAAAWESAHVFAARVLKDMSPIPVDYADDSYWPVRGA